MNRFSIFLRPLTILFTTILALPVAQGQIFPVAHCIEIKAGPPTPGSAFPTFIAHFGYTNIGATAVTLGNGPQNFHIPNNLDDNSNTFLPGYHPFATAYVLNLSNNSGTVTSTRSLSGHHVSLSIPTSDTVAEDKAQYCPLTVTPTAQSLSTTGTALAQPIARVRGDFGNSTVVVTPIGLTGGSGGVSVSNLVYTPTFTYFLPYGTAYTPGKITADIAASAWATPAVFVFQIAADGEPPQLISIPISYNPTSGNCASNLTAQTITTLGGFSQNIMTRVWTQTLRVQNSGASPIIGPVLLALDNLSANATLTSRNGVTNCAIPAGAPYVSLGTGLAPGQTVAVTLSFTNAQANQAITYTPRILSGGTQQ